MMAISQFRTGKIITASWSVPVIRPSHNERVSYALALKLHGNLIAKRIFCLLVRYLGNLLLFVGHGRLLNCIQN